MKASDLFSLILYTPCSSRAEGVSVSSGIVEEPLPIDCSRT